MTAESLAMEIARRNHAEYIQKRPGWHGMRVWMLLYYDPYTETAPKIGLPQFLLIGRKEHRIVSGTEALEYMQYLAVYYGYTEEGTLRGYKESEPIQVQ